CSQANQPLGTLVSGTRRDNAKGVGRRWREALVDRLELLQQFALDRFVTGDHLAVPDRAALTGEIGDEAAGFLDHQQARRNVPRGKAGFIEAIEPPGGQPGQVDRDRPGAADTGNSRVDGSELTHLQAIIARALRLDAGRDKGVGEMTTLCDTQALAVGKPGATTLFGGIE